MKTHIIYIYNGRDIQSKGNTIEANGVIKLIDLALEYIDSILDNTDKIRLLEYFTTMSYNNTVTYHINLHDRHGLQHSMTFSITGSAATSRKAIKHLTTLGIPRE